MFAHWIALDPGSNSLRLYDYFNDREVCLKTCIAYDKQKMIALAEQALAYVYQNKKDIKVRYPIKQGDILNDVTPLIRQALKELKVSQNVFKPCFLVCLNEDVSVEQKLKWQQQLAACKVRKVEFITPMEVLQLVLSSMPVILILRWEFMLMDMNLPIRSFILVVWEWMKKSR